MNSLHETLAESYSGRTVLVTGHTGFKGAWLSEWLLMLGARVVGVALPPNTTPALFDQLGLAERVEHHIQDIRDPEGLARIVLASQPDYVFHLAAQPLVRLSYREPVETYATNVMGTIHLLESLRNLAASYGGTERTCAAVFVTTDKCYENREWLHAYREEDALGGFDPYSSSKAAAELGISAYRRSFFHPRQRGSRLRVGISSARAGNVIGGGDWAEDRIVPDCVRCLQAGKAVLVRNPHATRPWQHVLEPLSGYLQLGMRQRTALESGNFADLESFCSAFNFGPALSSNRPVAALVERILRYWPGHLEDHSAQQGDAPHEAGKLNLAWDKAHHLLAWKPFWSFDETLERTVRWYQDQTSGSERARSLTQADIQAYGD